MTLHSLISPIIFHSVDIEIVFDYFNHIVSETIYRMNSYTLTRLYLFERSQVSW